MTGNDMELTTAILKTAQTYTVIVILYPLCSSVMYSRTCLRWRYTGISGVHRASALFATQCSGIDGRPRLRLLTRA